MLGAPIIPGTHRYRWLVVAQAGRVDSQARGSSSEQIKLRRSFSFFSHFKRDIFWAWLRFTSSEARNSAEQIRMCDLLINSLLVSSAPSWIKLIIFKRDDSIGDHLASNNSRQSKSSALHLQLLTNWGQWHHNYCRWTCSETWLTKKNVHFQWVRHCVINSHTRWQEEAQEEHG